MKMSHIFSLLVAAVGATIMLLAVLGYLPLREFTLSGTAAFNPRGHFVLSTLSLGLESAVASSATSGNLDVATYCVALERRLIGLALVGFTLLVVGAANARTTADEK